MQQLIIKLSPQATEQYLKIAAQNNSIETEANPNQDTSDIQLDINLSMMSGLCFTDIDVNGQNITSETDTEDLELELVEMNWC